MTEQLVTPPSESVPLCVLGERFSLPNSSKQNFALVLTGFNFCHKDYTSKIEILGKLSGSRSDKINDGDCIF